MLRADRLRTPIVLAAVVTLFAGWQTLYFTCDDAYIAFRYVANHMVGRGWTWNPPPFAPVEGYTSFAWVVLLEWGWRITGLEPPIASNLLGLGFGITTLLLATALVDRIGFRRPMLVLGLVLLGTVTNRTFLMWTTSGLETAMFVAVFTWWLYAALAREGNRGTAQAVQLFSAASLLSLVRPDGYLFLAACFPLLFAWRATNVAGSKPSVWAALPSLAVATHVVWRHQTYGEWLPNTYYAKSAGMWPSAGFRYLASFVVEYGIYVWILVATAALGVAISRRARPTTDSISTMLAVGAVVGHVAYYTVMIGGDHFEYRVFAHLVVPLFLSAAWLAEFLSARAVRLVGIVGLFIGLSWPIPWTEWSLSRDLSTRSQTQWLVVPVADSLPLPLRPVGHVWENLQRWLVPHSIGMRHQEHATLADTLVATLPTREEGANAQSRWITPLGSVGVLGWVYPNVAIIDVFGLNDRVVARWKTREEAGLDRRMAHDRLYPKGYYDCWRFNALGGQSTETLSLTFHADIPPMTDAEIVACETEWLAKAKARRATGKSSLAPTP